MVFEKFFGKVKTPEDKAQKEKEKMLAQVDQLANIIQQQLKTQSFDTHEGLPVVEDPSEFAEMVKKFAPQSNPYAQKITDLAINKLIREGKFTFREIIDEDIARSQDQQTGDSRFEDVDNEGVATRLGDEIAVQEAAVDAAELERIKQVLGENGPEELDVEIPSVVDIKTTAQQEVDTEKDIEKPEKLSLTQDKRVDLKEEPTKDTPTSELPSFLTEESPMAAHNKKDTQEENVEEEKESEEYEEGAMSWIKSQKLAGGKVKEGHINKLQDFDMINKNLEKEFGKITKSTDEEVEPVAEAMHATSIVDAMKKDGTLASLAGMDAKKIIEKMIVESGGDLESHDNLVAEVIKELKAQDLVNAYSQVGGEHVVFKESVADTPTEEIAPEPTPEDMSYSPEEAQAFAEAAGKAEIADRYGKQELPKENTPEDIENDAEKQVAQERMENLAEKQKSMESARAEYDQLAKEYYNDRWAAGALRDGFRSFVFGKERPKALEDKHTEYQKLASAYRQEKVNQSVESSRQEDGTFEISGQKVNKNEFLLASLRGETVGRPEDITNIENTAFDQRERTFLRKAAETFNTLPKPAKLALFGAVATGAVALSPTVGLGAAAGAVAVRMTGGLTGGYLGSLLAGKINSGKAREMNKEQILELEAAAKDAEKSTAEIDAMLHSQDIAEQTRAFNAKRLQMGLAGLGGALGGMSGNGLDNMFGWTSSPETISSHVATGPEELVNPYTAAHDALPTDYTPVSGDNITTILKNQVFANMPDADHLGDYEMNNAIENLRVTLEQNPDLARDFGISSGNIHEIGLSDQINTQEIYNFLRSDNIDIAGVDHASYLERAELLEPVTTSEMTVTENIVNYDPNNPGDFHVWLEHNPAQSGGSGSALGSLPVVKSGIIGAISAMLGFGSTKKHETINQEESQAVTQKSETAPTAEQASSTDYEQNLREKLPLKYKLVEATKKITGEDKVKGMYTKEVKGYKTPVIELSGGSQIIFGENQTLVVNGKKERLAAANVAGKTEEERITELIEEMNEN